VKVFPHLFVENDSSGEKRSIFHIAIVQAPGMWGRVTTGAGVGVFQKGRDGGIVGSMCVGGIGSTISVAGRMD